ncbi:MAG: PfkB family carbohydrate kinase [Nanoarchaeota archaeon]|nr:PfkB family carbohydrate kinase [Nanoarchaeota archaeon]
MAKIVVIGDVMLDRYYYCKNRNNPESSAPAYISSKSKIVHKPGGAGNVAANLASLKADFKLVSLSGKDADSEILESSLDELNIPYKFVYDKRKETIVKMRALDISDGRYHFRFDIEDKIEIADNHVEEIVDEARNSNLIVIADYNKGIINSKLMSKLKSLNIPILVDPKKENIKFYKNVFLIKPNSIEARDMANKGNDLKAAKTLTKILNSNILLTRSGEGIAYYGLNKDFFSYPSQPVGELKDVTGAGDSVIATFAHFYNLGKGLEECVRLANKAGSVAVCHLGCYHVKEKDLI